MQLDKDLRSITLQLSEQRARGIIDCVNDQKEQGLLDHRRFMEFVGRLVCVSQVLCWLRPYGAPPSLVAPVDGYAEKVWREVQCWTCVVIVLLRRLCRHRPLYDVVPRGSCAGSLRRAIRGPFKSAKAMNPIRNAVSHLL